MNGKLTAVKLQNGIELPCELAVVAIGVNPNTKLARESGIAIGETGVFLLTSTCKLPTRIFTQ